MPLRLTAVVLLLLALATPVVSEEDEVSCSADMVLMGSLRMMTPPSG